MNLVNERLWSFDIDGLFAYGPAATGNNDYTHKFLFEGDFSFKLGNALSSGNSQWNNLSAYAFLAYVVDGPPGRSRIEGPDGVALRSVASARALEEIGPPNGNRDSHGHIHQEASHMKALPVAVLAGVLSAQRATQLVK